MSGGGARTYKHPMTPMGGANEEQPQTFQWSRGVYELLHRRNTGAFCNTSLLEEQGQKSYNIHDILGTDCYL